MLKKVVIYDTAILVLVFAATFIFFREFTVIAVLGVLIALANFVLNAVITSATFTASGQTAFVIIGTVIRVILTVIIAVLLCKDNLIDFAFFLAGYTLHYISIIAYGVMRGAQKRRKGTE